MDTIRIHHADSDDQAKARQEQIITRLEWFGVEQVKAMVGHGFPSQWDPIIAAWLKEKHG